MLRANDTFGPGDNHYRYRLIRLLGSGVCKEVWLAERETAFLTTLFAVSFIIAADTDRAEIIEETKRWHLVSGHPNVIPIFEVNEFHGHLMIVSEYASGGTLKEWLHRHNGKAPTIESALAMTSDILKGLDHLHRCRILHRDLKPGNILMQGDTPRLADFGISRVMETVTQQTTDISGTPPYMSPEALQGQLTEQADVWSVGVMLHLMLAGTLPFPQPQGMLLHAILHDAPGALPDTVPVAVAEIVACALQKDRTQRYGSAERMRAALEAARDRMRQQSPRRDLLPSVPETSIPERKINPIDGAEMVLIPAGEFLMGDEDQSDNPRRTVTLEDYYIYKTPVTVAQYRKFCEATGKEMPSAPPWSWKDDHPIVNVRWEDAKGYSAWVGVRLPTEAQWEKAARGTDGRQYPWGDDWDNRKCANSERDNNLISTVPVGGYPQGASPYGVLDMSGNVWEWCEDWYDADHRYRTLRGGSWYSDNPYYFRCSDRIKDSPTYGYKGNGFRCAAGADSQ